MDLKTLLEKLKICSAKSFEGDPFKETLSLIVQYYSEVYQLSDDETSILLTDRDKTVLSFAYPEYLVNSGMIPINSPDAYTSYLYNLGRGSIDNNFNQQKHLHLFETIPTPEKKIKTIWKIMGTVLRDGDDKFGIIELCRKGETMADSGHEFTTEQLTFLEKSMLQIAPILKRYLPHDFRGKLI